MIFMLLRSDGVGGRFKAMHELCSQCDNAFWRPSEARGGGHNGEIKPTKQGEALLSCCNSIPQLRISPS